MGALEDRIAAAEAKVKQLKAEQQKVEARKKAIEGKRKRQDDNRRNILTGAVLLARVDRGEWPESELKAMMDKALTRADDRMLFGLPVTEDNDKKPESGTKETVPDAPA